jgi:thiamine monophosphate kinase
MQSMQVKRFVRTLSDAMKVASVKVVKGGTEQGMSWSLYAMQHG